MRYLKLFFFAACLSCLALQCDKDDNNDPPPPEDNKEELPPATQSGEGTFGCKVNGEVWVPEAPPNINELHADYYQDEFFVNGNRNTESNDQTIGIGLDSGWHGIGKYKLGFKQDINAYAVFIDGNKNCTYRTDTINTGKLTVTHFDSSKRIVSGRFHFTVVENGCDTIRVTEGRFDIQD